MRVLQVDADRSAKYRSRLSKFLAAQVDDGASLVCRLAGGSTGCRRSFKSGELIEGQLSHVGACYDLRQNDMPLRILIVPKQVGGDLSHGGTRGVEHVTVRGRVDQVDAAKCGHRPFPRTPHMDGTALALKVLLGLPCDAPERIVIDNIDRHVFDCFSMANATLCSHVRDDASGQGTAAMFRNCNGHLAETIRILRPTIIVTQGWSKAGWSPARSVAASFDRPTPPKNSCTCISSADWHVVFAALVHPSRSWATVKQFRSSGIEQVLLETRRQALLVRPEP